MILLYHWIPALAAATTLLVAALILRATIRRPQPSQKQSSLTSSVRGGLTSA